MTDHYIRIQTSVGNMSVIYIHIPNTKYQIKVIIGVNSLVVTLLIIKRSICTFSNLGILTFDNNTQE